VSNSEPTGGILNHTPMPPPTVLCTISLKTPSPTLPCTQTPMGGDHLYDKNQTSAWRVMCIMLRGSMKWHNGDFIVSLRIFHCTFHKNTWCFQ